jgi:putative flippase GtrA
VPVRPLPWSLVPSKLSVRGRQALTGEVSRFAVVGLTAYAVDVAVFNVVLLGLDAGPLVAKVVSSVFAITVAFIGSRWFTWRHRPRGRTGRQYALFFLLSVLAVFIQLGCLVVSNDVLGLTGPVADNISGNIVGMALATVFRFSTFRRYVFP